MADLNHVVLVGRLTRDAELKSIASGQSVCKFSIAVNRRRKNGDQWEDEVNYFDVVVWGRQGESLHHFLEKGKQVGVDGELKQDRWQQDGQNRSKVEIVANYVQLLGGKSNSSGTNSGGAYSGEANAGAPAGYHSNSAYSSNSQSHSGQQQGSPPPSEDNFADDIPF
jgi:single-strand DNA-binding protein